MHQAKKSDRTHRRLLEAAKTLFLQKGFDSTAVAEIAALAGYSTGVFYRHYKTKSDILVELWDSFLQRFINDSIRGAREAASLKEAMDFLIKRSKKYFTHPMFACYYQASAVRALSSGGYYTPENAKDFTSMLYELLRREYPHAEEARLLTYASTLHAVINAYSASEELHQDYSFDEAAIHEILMLLAVQAGCEPCE